mmetsp:Transcript_9517/g.26613  ORF Transcript_9517/g.26613 Transcript_9517/m.26613 type:complete len:212 (-) Transcript_9517:94-729(-)
MKLKRDGMVPRLPGLQHAGLFQVAGNVLFCPPSRANGLARITSGHHDELCAREQLVYERHVLLRLETDLLESNGGDFILVKRTEGSPHQILHGTQHAWLEDNTVTAERSSETGWTGLRVLKEYMQLVYKTLILACHVVSRDCVNHHHGRCGAAPARSHHEVPLELPFARIANIGSVLHKLGQLLCELFGRGGLAHGDQVHCVQSRRGLDYT